MYYYVIKETHSGVVVSSYLRRETAETFNPGAIIHEDTIIGNNYDLPAGTIIRGYAFNENGRYVKPDNLTYLNEPLVLCAKNMEGKWNTIKSLTNSGMTQLLASHYKETLILEIEGKISNLTIYEALEGLSGELAIPPTLKSEFFSLEDM
jgi:hypothetical protein